MGITFYLPHLPIVPRLRHRIILVFLPSRMHHSIEDIIFIIAVLCCSRGGDSPCRSGILSSCGRILLLFCLSLLRGGHPGTLCGVNVGVCNLAVVACLWEVEIGGCGVWVREWLTGVPGDLRYDFASEYNARTMMFIVALEMAVDVVFSCLPGAILLSTMLTKNTLRRGFHGIVTTT
ncbi:hypothetical protein BU16DRAFT_348775 [Lophium mytilinum]|uniref:Uncharacterized protein n=1 Tax=Lophium mytilinum TaxID=390894 RepID=A0A6A6QY81_9PEZI|nr:hypothetical protein BU16DRAFT_348775 [Lophium mytilinum]